MIGKPLFLNNKDWYTTETIVTEDGAEEVIFHLTEKAPPEAKKSFDEWNAALKAAKEGGYDM